MSFAAQLRAASGSMTAAQIAHATGYSKRTVEGWRSSRKQPRPQNQADVIRKVAEANIAMSHGADGAQSPSDLPPLAP